MENNEENRRNKSRRHFGCLDYGGLISNGILNIVAIEKSGGIENTISLNMNYNGLNDEKIEELIKKNNKIIEDDKKKIESNNKRIELEETCYYYQKDGSEKQKKWL